MSDGPIFHPIILFLSFQQFTANKCYLKMQIAGFENQTSGVGSNHCASIL